MGKLVFLDEYRVQQHRIEQGTWDDADWSRLISKVMDEVLPPHNLHEEEEVWREAYESSGKYDDTLLEDMHFDYLSACDLAMLSPSEVKWLIKHLINKNDFFERKEAAQEMLNEIIEEREDNS
jgi:hypothetical protein